MLSIKQTLTQNLYPVKDRFNNPCLEMELLLSFILKKPREFILTHNDFKLSKSQVDCFNRLLKRRLAGESLAYITGEKEFYGLKFFVNKNTLVPRPETEVLVDEVLSCSSCHSSCHSREGGNPGANETKRDSRLRGNDRGGCKNDKQNITYIDVGTGSGCIIVTLAKLLKNEIPAFTPRALPLGRAGMTEENAGMKEGETGMTERFFGTDISKKALYVARKNAKLHNISKKIKFLHGDLLEPILKNKKSIADNRKLIITANLPYLTPKQVKNSSTIQFEPKLALVAGNDGLKYYRKLFKQIKEIRDTRREICVMCEIDPSQTKPIKELIKKILPKSKVKIKKDLAGRDRFVIIFL